MGFEQAPGHIPTRKQQIDAIQRLQQNWLSQPWYKFYMNEDVRRNKLAFADRLNKARSQFFFNFALFGLLYMPAAVMLKRFFITRNSLPMIIKPSYFDKQRTPAFARSYYYGYWAASFWIGATTATAASYTNFYSYVGDQFYKYGAKPEKMI